jgi:hypothetical protein
MKKMLAIGLATTLGITGLVLSAMGQQQGQDAQSLFNQANGQKGVDPNGRLLYESGITPNPYYQSILGYGNYSNPMAAGETEKLARQLAKAKTEGERENVRGKLNDLLEKQFDERQKRHKAESEALEAQVKKLKDLISTRNENRKEIINRRLEQIVRDAQGLGW